MSGQTARNKRSPAQPRTWFDVEPEVEEYCRYEPGAPSANLDSNGGGGFGSKMLSFTPGADPYTMMTVLERFAVADQIMPMRTVRYELHVVETPTLWGPSKIDAQVPKGRDQPSASMVLRAAYGTQACKFNDSAPNGAALLEKAKEAYLSAAMRVPARVRPRRIDVLNARFDREFNR